MSRFLPSGTAVPPGIGTAAEARLMLDYAVRWHRFGGGPTDEIFVNFGVDRETFGRRVITLLDWPDARIDAVVATGIRGTYGRLTSTWCACSED